MAKGSESGEIVVSSIRAGMKREFAMMMKTQAECGIPVGQRRVTRARNGPFSDGGLNSPGSDSRAKSSEAKKRKNEVKNVKLEEKFDEEVVEDEEMERKDGGELEKAVPVSVEEAMPVNEKDGSETGLMDGDEDGKGNVVEIGKEGGVNDKIDTESNCGDVAKNEIELDSNVAKEIDGEDGRVIENCKAVNEELKEDIFVRMVHKELRERLDKKEIEFDVSGGGKRVETAVTGDEGNGDNGVSEKPLRQYTRRAALKQKDEAVVASGTGDFKAVEPVERDVGSSIKGMEPVESDAGSPMATPLKMEMKMSKKVELKRVPTRLKELLETGLLEGLPVRYVRGAKGKVRTETGLRGIIKGTGILCCCDDCDGTKVMTPNQFELHAGSSNKRPPEYLYLENGNSLRDVLNVCKDAPADSLEVAIQNAIGCSNAKKPTYCLNCKGPISEAGSGKSMLLCDSCVVLEESLQTPSQMSDNSDRPSVCVSDTKSSGQMASSIPRVKGQGRLTRKDLRMHKLVFEEDVLPDGTALAYYARGEKLLEGYKKGFGIFCYCCDSEVSPSQFEAHAGCASRRKPYLHIYTSNGVSLHELSIKLSKERKLSSDENDDLCSICADGGDLLCCDNCPRAFHTDCVSLPSLPQGTWYCRYCQNMFLKEKFVERNANAIAAGRVSGVDPLEQITRRCIRIVEAFDSDASSCVLCRSHDFSKSGFGPRTVIICDQCEKEYHIGCLKDHNMGDLKELPKDKWFCCGGCNRIHCSLEKLVADGEMKLPEVLLAMIKKKHAGKGSDDNPDLDIRWRLFRGKLGDEDSRKWLSGAVTIFHEQFDPIADANTSRLDLIPLMVFGRNFKDQDLGGMYTAILTINSLVVSAGIIRIFGEDVAELPLVATSSDFQGQGYFQSLFSCIENMLGTLNVRELVLPSAKEAEAIWINRFGFEKLTEEQLTEYRKDYQMMIFQGTSVLHKSVLKS